MPALDEQANPGIPGKGRPARKGPDSIRTPALSAGVARLPAVPNAHRAGGEDPTSTTGPDHPASRTAAAQGVSAVRNGLERASQAPSGPRGAKIPRPVDNPRRSTYPCRKQGVGDPPPGVSRSASMAAVEVSRARPSWWRHAATPWRTRAPGGRAWPVARRETTGRYPAAGCGTSSGTMPVNPFGILLRT